MIQKILIVPHKYYKLFKQCLIFVVQNPNSSRNMSKCLYPRFLFWPSNLGVALPPPNSFVSHMRPTLAKSGGGPASRTPCGSNGGSSAETPTKPSCLAPPAPANSPCGKKAQPKPSPYPIKPKRRMTFKNDRFFNYMFSKHVLMHQYAIIPLIILSFGTNLALLIFQLTRNVATRPDIKWTTKSHFPYQNYDLEKPWNHQSKLFNYFQRYVPFPDLKKLYGIIKQAKEEFEEEERKKKEAEELQAANVIHMAEVARAAESARLAQEAEKAQAAELARAAERARAAEKAQAAELAREAKKAAAAEKAAEKARAAEEKARAAEEARAVEEARKNEIARAAEEARKIEEAGRGEVARAAQAVRAGG